MNHSITVKPDCTLMKFNVVVDGEVVESFNRAYEAVACKEQLEMLDEDLFNSVIEEMRKKEN